MSQPIHLTGITEPHHAGKRLDQVVAELFADYSRTRLKDWILAGKVLLDGFVQEVAFAGRPQAPVVQVKQLEFCRILQFRNAAAD